MKEAVSPTKLRVLALDDDLYLRDTVRSLLSDEYDVVSATTPREAMGLFYEMAQADALPVAMILDIKLPEISGIELLKMARQRYPDVPVVMLTANSDPRSIVEAMKAGAAEYVVKGTPDFAGELKGRLLTALRTHELASRNKKLEAKINCSEKRHEMVGESPAILDVRAKTLSLKGRDTTVLITGESGSGKELVARTLNRQEDCARPFAELNCATIPKDLAESTLFGHEKGSFTHAHQKQPGMFAEANGGDLFLDEIGELPLDVQAKLLRALQEKKYTPVGATKPVSARVRIIAATNRDLRARVRTGEFREDLYYRISVFPIEVPALRQRKEDIGMLATYFLREFSGGRATFSNEALKFLESHDWPGNVRALRNCVERAWIMADPKGQLTVTKDKILFDDVRAEEDADGLAVPSEFLAQSADDINASHYRRFVDWAEKTYYQAALNALPNKTRLAEKLSMSRTLLFRRVKELRLDQ